MSGMHCYQEGADRMLLLATSAQKTMPAVFHFVANNRALKASFATFAPQVMPMEERFALVERVRARANAQVRVCPVGQS
eukprot:1143635-Pelagomonas_calceolata.AAC.8